MTRRDRAAPLVAFAVGLAVLWVLVAFGRLGAAEAGLGSLALLAAAPLVLRLAVRPHADARESQVANTLDPAIERFADVLFEPCIVINARSIVAYRNTAALDKFPRMRAGDPLAFTLRDPEVVDAIAHARREGGPAFAEMHKSVPNETWFRVSVVPFVPDPADEQTFLVLSLYDLTEQRRTDQLRADFVANASHELRTPLTSLTGFIETLQGPAARDAEARARFLTIMRTQSERMRALIEDLLSLSRIEQRQHVRPTERVALVALLGEVVESAQVRARETGLAIQTDLPDERLEVIGDRRELFEVFENLLDNALKYGEGGEKVEVALTPARAGARDTHSVAIRDYGPGIPEEHVPRLTERFYRVDAESSRKKKGTGLGLAIVKHIVNRHHGQLVIRSQLGVGTRVEVLLQTDERRDPVAPHGA